MISTFDPSRVSNMKNISSIFETWRTGLFNVKNIIKFYMLQYRYFKFKSKKFFITKPPLLLMPENKFSKIHRGVFPTIKNLTRHFCRIWPIFGLEWPEFTSRAIFSQYSVTLNGSRVSFWFIKGRGLKFFWRYPQMTPNAMWPRPLYISNIYISI